MCVLCVQCPQRSEEGVESPGTAFIDGCEPPYRLWELNSGPLQEKQVLFVMVASPAPGSFVYVLYDQKSS